MSLARTETGAHLLSTSQSKIALFRFLFRGRDDVYARRFESRKTGKSGYAPACGQGARVPLRRGHPGRARAQARFIHLTETMERRPVRR